MWAASNQTTNILQKRANDLYFFAILVVLWIFAATGSIPVYSETTNLKQNKKNFTKKKQRHSQRQKLLRKFNMHSESRMLIFFWREKKKMLDSVNGMAYSGRRTDRRSGRQHFEICPVCSFLMNLPDTFPVLLPTIYFKRILSWFFEKSLHYFHNSIILKIFHL